jgi:ribose 1,5-bisphosphate isomerase
VIGGEFLGASRNIRQIHDLFSVIAEEGEGSPADIIRTLVATGEYLIATRGKNTPAIANSIRMMLNGLDESSVTTRDEVREIVRERRDALTRESLRNRDLLAEVGANVLSNCDVLLAFDYSSTMMAILDELARRGRYIRVIVPESRVLDGGRPIANEATASGHSVSFLVDMAFAHALRECDAVLIGAETIFANGDCWNTVGSYPIAVLAARYGIPYYVATELIKIDPLSFMGLKREMKLDDYSRLLQYPETFTHPERVSVVAPEMDNVPGSLITAYITPRGLLLPEHLRDESLRFLESIGVPVLPGMDKPSEAAQGWEELSS